VKQTFAPNKQSDEKSKIITGEGTNSTDYPFVCLLEDGEPFVAAMDDLLHRVMSLLHRSCKDIIQHRVLSRLRCLESGNHQEDNREGEASVALISSALVPAVSVTPFCHYRQTFTRHCLSVTCMTLYNSSQLLTGSGDRRVHLWDRDRMEVLHTFPGPAGVHSLLISGDSLFIGYTNKTIAVWNLVSRTLILTHKTRNLEAMILLPTEDPSISHLYTGHSKSFRRSEVRLESNPPTITETVSLVGRDDTVYCTAFFHNGGHILFTGSVGHTIRAWDIRYFGTDHTIVYLSGHTGRVRCLLTQGTQLFSGSDDHTIRLWDIITLTPVTLLEGHQGPITALAALGTLLYSASKDRTIGIWNLMTNERLYQLTGHSEGVNCLAIDAQRLYSGGGDFTVKLWEEEQEQDGGEARTQEERLRIENRDLSEEDPFEERDQDPFCDDEAIDLLQEEEVPEEQEGRTEELRRSEEKESQQSAPVVLEDID
jgi:WD40 repeat protein